MIATGTRTKTRERGITVRIAYRWCAGIAETSFNCRRVKGNRMHQVRWQVPNDSKNSDDSPTEPYGNYARTGSINASIGVKDAWINPHSPPLPFFLPMLFPLFRYIISPPPQKIDHLSLNAREKTKIGIYVYTWICKLFRNNRKYLLCYVDQSKYASHP